MSQLGKFKKNPNNQTTTKKNSPKSKPSVELNLVLKKKNQNRVKLKKLQALHLLWFEKYKSKTLSGIKTPFQKPEALGRTTWTGKNRHISEPPNSGSSYSSTPIRALQECQSLYLGHREKSTFS